MEMVRSTDSKRHVKSPALGAFFSGLLCACWLATPVPVAHAVPAQDATQPLRTIRATQFTDQVIAPSHDHPVVLEFFATWCGPCKEMEPILKSAAVHYRGRADFVRIDIDKDKDLAEQLALSGVPTIIVYENGIAMGRLDGAVAQADVRALIDSYLE